MNEKVQCICDKAQGKSSNKDCELCGSWYHRKCVRIEKSIKEEERICPRCEQNPAARKVNSSKGGEKKIKELKKEVETLKEDYGISRKEASLKQ